MVNGQVILKHGRDKNVRAHHPWVFSGAVDKVKGKPLSGESVEVRTASGDLLGIGAWSPASQIQVQDALVHQSIMELKANLQV